MFIACTVHKHMHMYCGWATNWNRHQSKKSGAQRTEFDYVNILTVLAFDLECEMFWNCVIRVNLPVLLVRVVGAAAVQQDKIGYIVKLMFLACTWYTHRVCVRASSHVRLFSNARENLALWNSFGIVAATAAAAAKFTAL